MVNPNLIFISFYIGKEIYTLILEDKSFQILRVKGLTYSTSISREGYRA